MYKEIVRPILSHLDSETWHKRTLKGLHLIESNDMLLKAFEYSVNSGARYTDPRLATDIKGVHFDLPVIVGAGEDKAGLAVRAWHAMGFAGPEIGTVPAWDQDGNPTPRQSIIDELVIWNWLGFNSPGMNRVDKNLVRYLNSGIPIGISLGKNKEVPDKYAPFAHAIVAQRLYRHAAYFVINVSSPNTLDLTRLQDKGPLTDIAQAVNETMDSLGGRIPLLVKISPDLTDTAVDDVIGVVLDNGLAGIVATNTTINEGVKARYGYGGRPGGLSGNDAEYRAMSTHKVAHIRRVAGKDIVIFGVGGVHDADTALEKIRAGANRVQLVGAIPTEGPRVAVNINKGISRFLDREVVKHLDDLVGVDANKY